MVEISYLDKENPCLKAVIGGYEYYFSVSSFDETRYDWLCDVLGRQMQEIHDRAVLKTTREIQADLKRLIGIKD